MLDLSWRAVAVGAIISLIALPANLIIIMLFRRSKVREICPLQIFILEGSPNGLISSFRSIS